jgi:hypothetical protein
MAAMTSERITNELNELARRGVSAEYVEDGGTPAVVYRAVPVGRGEPDVEVAVKIPDGYPGAQIDGAALTLENIALLGRLKGGTNPQGEFKANGRQWRIASYHPHANGGGPPWNPLKHGFHTYYDELVSWTHDLA